MLGYQKGMMDDLGLDFQKLVLTLEDKSNYVVHCKNMRFYLRQGMRFKKVNRVIAFEQEPWIESYIRIKTEFRKKAKSEFDTTFYKLMNNSVFGKTMENLRNHVDMKLVRTWEAERIRRMVASASYARQSMRYLARSWKKKKKVKKAKGME